MLTFENDILPLFRSEDIEEMSFVLDLASYEAVRAHAHEIYRRLADGTMPCDGPWPEEHIDRFGRWVELGTPA